MPTTPNYTDIIALIALVVSIGSLFWNIIRDLIFDRVKIDVAASIGGLLPVQGMPTKFFFRDTDDEYKPTNPLLSFTITNVGRRPILISKIWGKYTKKAQTSDLKKPMFLINTVELPKMIRPYELINELCHDRDFMIDLKAGKVSNLYVTDSKGTDWPISKRNKVRLLRTVNKTNFN